MAVFPLVNPIFQPALRQIAALSTTPVTGTDLMRIQVTTTVDHLYQNGLVVRLTVPEQYQAVQFNNLFGQIVVTGATTFYITLPSFAYDSFVIPVAPLQYAQVVPLAENVLLLNSAVQNVLP